MTAQTLSRVTLQTLENYRTAATQAVVAYRLGGHRLVGAVNGALKNGVYPRTAKMAPRATERLNEVRGSVSKIVVKGIEPQVNVRLTPQWHVQAAATFLSIDVRDGLQQLRNRPEKVASASTWFDFDARNSVFGTVRYVGHFLDRSNPTGDIEMPSFTVFDAGYTFTYGPMRLRLSLDNVFDRTYEQFVGFPAQGRRVRAELRGSF